MPLPLGHAAIGLAVHSCVRGTEPEAVSWKTLLFITILANLPDIDVLLGLVIVGNGSAFHRGPTHSLIFVIVMALVASRAWRFAHAIPRVSFLWSFLLILSHVLADVVFTTSSVSLLWPLEVNWSNGHSNWTDVISAISFGAYKDAGVILGFGLLIVIGELLRYRILPLTQWGLCKTVAQRPAHAVRMK